MAWNMPDGATTEEYDRYCGYDLPDEDSEQEQTDEPPEGLLYDPSPFELGEDEFESHAGVNRRNRREGKE